MTENERQFRKAGWRREYGSLWIWKHPECPAMMMDTVYRDELMGIWLSGYDAGKSEVAKLQAEIKELKEPQWYWLKDKDYEWTGPKNAEGDFIPGEIVEVQANRIIETQYWLSDDHHAMLGPFTTEEEAQKRWEEINND